MDSQIFIKFEDILFVLGAATCCIWPLFIGAVIALRYKIVRR